MNWNEFKDPVFHICLAGTVVAGSNLLLVRQIFLSLNSLKIFRETQICTVMAYTKILCYGFSGNFGKI